MRKRVKERLFKSANFENEFGDLITEREGDWVYTDFTENIHMKSTHYGVWTYNTEKWWSSDWKIFHTRSGKFHLEHRSFIANFENLGDAKFFVEASIEAGRVPTSRD